MTLADLRGRHTGQTAAIVGTGPSLLGLTAASLGDGPVLALNDAIVVLRRLRPTGTLYSLQKDGCLVSPRPPEILVLSRGQSPDCFAGYPARVVVDVVADLGRPANSVSSHFAVALAHAMGCAGVRMLGQDGFTRGDGRRVRDGELVATSSDYHFAGRSADWLARHLKLHIEWVA